MPRERENFTFSADSSETISGNIVAKVAAEGPRKASSFFLLLRLDRYLHCFHCRRTSIQDNRAAFSNSDIGVVCGLRLAAICYEIRTPVSRLGE